MAKRYGWFYNQIYYEMYWEDVYEMYEYASNLEVLERNDDLRFQYALHAMTKKKWEDLPIPFPSREYIEMIKNHKTTLTQSNINPKVAHVTKRAKASPERLARLKQVKERLLEHKIKQKAVEEQLTAKNYAR